MDILDFFERSYLNAKNKRELDYWQPLANISGELTTLLYQSKITMAKLSTEINTPLEDLQGMQSLEYITQYDLLEKICFFFKQRPAVSMFGDYTATLSVPQHKAFEELAKSKNRDKKTLLEEILEAAVSEEIKKSKIAGG